MYEKIKNLLHHAKFFAEETDKGNKYAQITHKFWEIYKNSENESRNQTRLDYAECILFKTKGQKQRLRSKNT